MGKRILATINDSTRKCLESWSWNRKHRKLVLYVFPKKILSYIKLKDTEKKKLVLPQKKTHVQTIFIFKETYLERTDFVNSPWVFTPPTRGKRMNMSSLFLEVQMFGEAMRKYILSFLTNAALVLSSFWRKIKGLAHLAPNLIRSLKIKSTEHALQDISGA